MPISYDEKTRTFNLVAGHTSYVMRVVREGYLAHLYWGPRVRSLGHAREIIFKDRGFCPNPTPDDRAFSLDTLPQEYPQYGNGDFRSPAYGVRDKRGSRISDLRYVGHAIRNGKPRLEGLPATFGSDEEVETLEVHLADETSGLHAFLSYSVFADLDVICRSVRFENRGAAPLMLAKMLSASIDIRDDKFDVLTLWGRHNCERNFDRRPLTSGTVEVGSLRGTSSPEQAPFMALLRPQTNEDAGEVFALNLVYSGNFTAVAQVDPYRNVRLQMGMNPWDGEWQLDTDKVFQTPEVVMAHSIEGLNGVSHTFHSLYLHHLMRGPWVLRDRPVLANSWETCFFDFDEKKLLGIARIAAKVGAELFVLDDGWFGHRDDDTSSLGDWVVDRRKLPHGLGWLSDRVHELGLGFGIWVEPEMVSEGSDLYREHPDWVLHTEGRPYTWGRSQLVLDLTRRDVRDYIVRAIGDVLRSARIEYVKWDMNRHLTDVGASWLPAARQGEVFHRYVLGLYEVMDRLTSEFPDVLWESCSSGGGRFDPGMLYYMPQTWTSDDTDPVCRAEIQYSTSLAYPQVTMGAHLSESPNQQTGRVTPIATRANVAMGGNFGIELDLTRCSDDELEQIARQVSAYKELRHTLQFGRLWRGRNPFEGNEASWNVVSADGDDVVAFYLCILSQPGAPIRLMRLRGLDPNANYQDVETGMMYGGDELMYAGLSIPIKKQDFRSERWHFRRL